MDETKFQEVIRRAQELKASGTVDLSMEEDLSIAVMNLISLEEHFYFSGAKSEDDAYFEMMSEVREMRKVLLGRMIDHHEVETWCISKHLLATTMRLMEVGTKLFSDNKKEDAKAVFDQAHRIYSMFWALRLKLISVPELKEAADQEKPWTLKDITNRLVDCCKE
jgi:hypothetical protein